VESLTKGIKGKHSAGYDDVPECIVKQCIVKQCIQLVKKPLTHIYNVSLNFDLLHNEWKTAKVRPVYNKGERYDIQNYRPISVLSHSFSSLSHDRSKASSKVSSPRSAI
jgi:hypothetical protein